MKKKFNIAKYIEHTNVSPTTSRNDIKKICKQAKDYGFYAVCVTPSMVNLAKKFLLQSSVKVVSVVGFPHGTSTFQAKTYEARQAIKNGADEIDMTMNVSALKDKDYKLVFKEIKAVVQAVSRKPVKVILGVGYLTNNEIQKACQLAQKAGAHFIKTNTSYGPRGVKLNDIRLISRTVKHKMRIKASGGIRTYRKALSMIMAGADRIGTSHGINIVRQQKTIKN